MSGDETVEGSETGGPDSAPALRELDFSKLPAGADFAQTMVLKLRLGGQDLRVELSTRGMHAAMDGWYKANPSPERQKRVVTILPTDEYGKKLKLAGYKGAWPALREILDQSDKEYEEKVSVWVAKCAWRVVSLAFPEIKDHQGKALVDHEERAAFLQGIGMLDRHAVELMQELAKLRAVTVETADQEAADFFGEA